MAGYPKRREIPIELETVVLAPDDEGDSMVMSYCKNEANEHIIFF